MKIPVFKLPKVSLFHAAWQCRTEVLRERISEGEDVNMRGAEQRTPLVALALVGAGTDEQKVETATILLDAGAEIDLVDEHGHTALMYAAAAPDPGLVRLLIERGADVNRAAPFGRVPLDFAEERRSAAENKQILLDAGARPSAPEDPLLSAVRAGHQDSVRDLIAEGRSPNPADQQGRSALMHAAEKPDEAMVRILVDAGVDLEHSDARKHGALHAAARGGDAAIVRLLVERGASVEGVAPKGAGVATPLISAASAGRLEAVRALIEAGADLKAKAGGDVTALKAARAAGERKVAALIKEALAGGAAQASSTPREVSNDVFDGEAERLSALFEKKGVAWKRRNSVTVFRPTSKRLLALADERFGAETAPEGRDKDEFREDRLDRIVEALQDEVREKGLQLIEHSADRKSPLLLFPTADPYAVLQACGTNGDNYGHDTDDVCDWLRELEKTAPFVLTGCGHDFAAGSFRPPRAETGDLARRVVEFAPDVIDGEALESADELAAEMAREQEFFLWWD